MGSLQSGLGGSSARATAREVTEAPTFSSFPWSGASRPGLLPAQQGQREGCNPVAKATEPLAYL